MIRGGPFSQAMPFGIGRQSVGSPRANAPGSIRTAYGRGSAPRMSSRNGAMHGPAGSASGGANIVTPRQSQPGTLLILNAN